MKNQNDNAALAAPPAQQAGAFTPVTGSVDRDWHEDASHENGNYLCRCVACGNEFIGHKRRVTCKPCAEEAKRWWDSLTPEQYAAEKAKQEEAVREWMTSRNTEASRGA